MGFPRLEYWNGLPFPSPGDLPNSGIKLTSLMAPALAGGFFTTVPPGMFRCSINCCCSVVKLWPTLCGPMDHSTPGFPVLHDLPEFAQTHVRGVSIPSNYLLLCHPLLHLPSIFPSIRVFSNESCLHIRWPKYWSFSFIISPSKENLGWFPLGLTGLVSLLSKGLSRVFSSTMVLAGTLFCISETHSSVEYCWFFSIFQFFIFLFYLQGESLILS